MTLQVPNDSGSQAAVLPNPQRLLHITHARQDEPWVRGVVIPALGLSEGQYWTRAEDDMGAPKLEELERAVQSCRYTLLVASRAAQVDKWTTFTGILAQHLGIEEGKPRLLVVARDLELLPLRHRCLVCLDCSDPETSAAALATLAAQLALTTTEQPLTECPYPGLRMFGTGDPRNRFNRTDLFFGRDGEGREIIDKLCGGGRVLLVGPSGCGKSSLVRARVLPKLGEGHDAMAIAIVRPGAHPDVALRAAIETLDPQLGLAIDSYLIDDKGTSLTAMPAGALRTGRLLYVDQLEEVFLDDSPGGQKARAQFFARLAALGRVPGAAILLGMRADFYSDLMRSPIWNDFRNHRVELAPLRGAALRQAITRPAEVVGVHVEVDLVERLVREADFDRAAEALPLLQVALEQIWKCREWRYLSLASYERIAEGKGRGLDVVLAHHADATMDALDEPIKMLARRVLTDLVHLGEGRPDTRRRRNKRELGRAGDASDALDAVLNHLLTGRLITVGAEPSSTTVTKVAANAVTLASADGVPEVSERYVDLAHDTLITGWPALAGWISERRDALRTHRRLEARAAGGGLLAASELPEFIRWIAWTSTPAGQELGASQALHELVQRSTAARSRRIRGLAALMVMLAVVASIAFWQRSVAVDNANLAEQRATAEKTAKDASQRLLAQSYQEAGQQLVIDQQRPLQALPYLVAAAQATGGDDPGPSLRMLFAQATKNLPLVMLEHQGRVSTAAFSPDSTRVVTSSWDGTVQVWSASTGNRLMSPIMLEYVWAAAFSPDGTRIVTTSSDNAVRIWNAATGKPVFGPLKHQDSVNSATFSPDSTRLVTAGRDKVAQVWDARTGERLTPPLVHQAPVRSAAFNFDGTLVVTASEDKTARIWNAITGKAALPPLEHRAGVTGAVFSPDGRHIATASDDKTAQVWDVLTGKPLFLPLQHLNSVNSVAFSPDGTRIVTASSDHTARVWSATTGELLVPPFEHEKEVASAIFSPDGTRIATISNDNAARIWDVTAGASHATLLEHQENVTSVAFSQDGRRVITASYDYTARIWGLVMTMPKAVFRLPHQNFVMNATFSPDGTRIVTASDDGTARVWNAATGMPLSQPLRHGDGVVSVAFSPDSARVVTASKDHTARVWDAATGEPISQPLQHQEELTYAAFSRDGTRVVTTSYDSTARVWDAVTGKPLSPPLKHQNTVWRASFSPDGARIVTASFDKTARIWDVATGQPQFRPLQHDDVVWSAAYSPDGTRIITSSDDGTARLWNAITGDPLTPALYHGYAVTIAAFSPDSTRIVTASQDNAAHIWDVATGRALTQPLQHEGRLTSVMFSLDNTRVITSSHGSAYVWDAATGKLLMLPLQHGSEVESASFNPDGTRVVTASIDSIARVWDLPLAPGTLADWSNISERASPYVLINGIMSTRVPRKQPADVD